jgi:DNA-binding transcriptional MerR regulator
LLSIGEFSKICGVTTRALRYYDDIDLIKPKHISSESGYRFYDVSQIRQLLFINRLKGYGFSLEEIADILTRDDKNYLLEKILTRQEQIKIQINLYEEIENQLLGDIKNLKRGLDIMTFINDFEVHLVETKEQTILYSRQRMSVNDYCKYISNLFSLAYSKGMTIAAAPISIYYDQEFDPTDNDTAVALPVAEVNEHTRSLPGGLCATAVCKGAYSTLPNVYAKLTEWISENGYQVVSAPYEQYIKGPIEAKSADDFITNVYFPVKKI